MQKKELRAMERINATPEMVRMAKGNSKTMKYKYKYSCSCIEKKTKYDLMVRCRTCGDILMVCIFLPEKVAAGELTPSYEIYCDITGGGYITRILKDGKETRWSRAMIDNIDGMCLYHVLNGGYWYVGIENRIWQNPVEQKKIKQLLKSQAEGLRGLLEWQRDERKRRIREAEEREQATWDADMGLIPETLPGFRQ